MILSSMLKRPTKKIKAFHFQLEGKILRMPLLFKKTQTQDLAITTPILKMLWTDLPVDSRWPKISDSSIRKKKTNPVWNLQLCQALDFTQSSRQSEDITRSFPKTKISILAQNSYCQKMSLAELKQSLNGKYVILELISIDNPQVTRTGDFTAFNRKKGFTVGKSQRSNVIKKT